MLAQLDVRVNLEDGPWLRRHVIPYKSVPPKQSRAGFSKGPVQTFAGRESPRKLLKRRRSPTKHSPMLSSREALCRSAARAISRTWVLEMFASGKRALSRLDSVMDER